jgi:hypothetical protein
MTPLAASARLTTAGQTAMNSGSTPKAGTRI